MSGTILSYVRDRAGLEVRQGGQNSFDAREPAQARCIAMAAALAPWQSRPCEGSLESTTRAKHG
jgi:hypothetical protein